MNVPERLRWALETLQIAPDDRVLEIGGGRGVLASLVCDRLSSGTYTGLDRSATATRAARDRNREHMASGRASFEAVAAADADLADARFDKVVAVNVNAFWLDPTRELAAIRRMLAPDGALYLFFEPPSAEMTQDIAARVAANLEASGLEVTDTLHREFPSGAAVGVIARIRRISGGAVISGRSSDLR